MRGFAVSCSGSGEGACGTRSGVPERRRMNRESSVPGSGRPEQGGVPFDAGTPSIARVYDYWLDGKDNFAADREVAEQVRSVVPQVGRQVRDHRDFLVRAVTYVATQGITQFLDLGAGMPVSPSVHDTARAGNPGARVAYVDFDPVVISHASALLAGEGVAAVLADLRDPGTVLGSGTVRDLIDPGQPACVILNAVLHFLPARTAQDVTAEYIRGLAPGSYVIISTGRADDDDVWREFSGAYKAGQFYNHSREEVAGFFDGLELVSPGLTDASVWRAGWTVPGGRTDSVYVLAGVGRK